MSITRIQVRGDQPYEVCIGPDAASLVAESVGVDVTRVAVLHAPTVPAVTSRVVESLRASGREVVTIELPDAESAKSADVLINAWSVLGQAGFTRSDAIVGVGGGATTDVAGFIAASWLRGVRLVQVPTTTLGMVDAAVGGKTGINTSEGKNLVGAFHPPVAVLCDLDVLATLPQHEHRAGLAEVVKAGFIADPVILELIEADAAAALDPTSAVARELIERSIAVKAHVVSEDLREVGATSGVSREFLNYGHTFGHAIEKVEAYQWRHGHAVSVGMVFVAELAARAGRIDADLLARHRFVLELVGLPLTYRGDRWPELRSAMSIDKKSRGARLRFVVLDALAQPGILDAPSEELLEASYAAIQE